MPSIDAGIKASPVLDTGRPCRLSIDHSMPGALEQTLQRSDRMRRLEGSLIEDITQPSGARSQRTAGLDRPRTEGRFQMNPVDSHPRKAKTMAAAERSRRVDHQNKLTHYYSQRLLFRWREASASIRMLPHFIVAGVPKCGTTALYYYLLSHPQVARPSQNEIGFFTENYQRGPNWYRAHFPTTILKAWRNSDKEIITGEHTPSYVLHPLAAKRMADTVPHVRLIILLRDPVDRAYSHYQHEFRTGHESLDFPNAIRAEPQRTANEIDRMRLEPGYRSPEYIRHAYVDQGKYQPKLEPIFRYFNRNQVMIIKAETLFARTQDVFDSVLDFLSLDPFKLNKIERVNSGEYLPLRAVDPVLDGELREYFGPSNKSLYSLLGVDYGW